METVPVIGHLQPYFKLHLYKRVIKTLKIQLDKKDKYKKKYLAYIFLEREY